MKILVCISKVPDTTTKISFTDNNTKFNEDKVQFIINPYDEWYALVRALELKETLGGTVTVINVGKVENEQIIRKALALGADDAVRIDTDPVDAFVVANEIAGYAKTENYDLILTGKETIDYNGGVVAGMIAELLELPYVSLAAKLNADANVLHIERETEGMKEMIKVMMPCIVGAQKGMAEARIPNMRGILASKTKPVKIIEATTAARVQFVSFELPPEKGACKMFAPDNVNALADALHNEAKVF
ncbi:MAG: electron transfer flavoprotein subunit beta/FixA family protein [Chitinophagales bacterium]